MSLSEKLMICIVDDQEKIVLEKKITHLPLREEIIKTKSLEFFHDPEPCMIRRSAVMKRLFLELGDIFLEAQKHNKPDIPWRELPEKVHQYLNVQGNINRVVIKKQF